jgi:hypothetical protein
MAAASFLAAACGGVDPSSSSDPVVDVSDPVLGGQGETERRGVVEVKFDVGGGVRTCSGIVISPYMVLTAAHCTVDLTPVPNESARASVKVRYKKGGAYRCISGSTDATGRCTSYYPARLFTNSAFRDGDAETDIAKVMPEWGNFDVGTDDLAYIYEDSMSFTPRIEAFGYGSNAFNGDGVGTLRGGSEEVDWYGSRHFITIDRGTRLCSGDSGGPAMVYQSQTGPEAQAVGLLSNGSVTPSGHCGALRGKERFVRLSAYVQWIQSGPWVSVFCTPVVSPYNGRRVEQCY